MSENSYDYSARKGIQPISWEDFHGICRALAVAVSPYQPDIILAIGRGGYYPGTLLAHLLQAEIYPVRVSRRVNDVVQFEAPTWLVEPPPLIKGQRLLIVDDICSSGETIGMVRKKAKLLGAEQIKSAVMYAHTWGASIPNYIGLITDSLLLNPWDREILCDGRFQFHPEYVEALRQQGLEPDPALLIQTSHFELAKGT